MNTKDMQEQWPFIEKAIEVSAEDISRWRKKFRMVTAGRSALHDLFFSLVEEITAEVEEVWTEIHARIGMIREQMEAAGKNLEIDWVGGRLVIRSKHKPPCYAESRSEKIADMGPAKAESAETWDFLDTGECLDVGHIFVRVPRGTNSERKHQIRDAVRVGWRENTVRQFTEEERKKANEIILVIDSNFRFDYTNEYYQALRASVRQFFRDLGLLTKEPEK